MNMEDERLLSPEAAAVPITKRQLVRRRSILSRLAILSAAIAACINSAAQAQQRDPAEWMAISLATILEKYPGAHLEQDEVGTKITSDVFSYLIPKNGPPLFCTVIPVDSTNKLKVACANMSLENVQIMDAGER